MTKPADNLHDLSQRPGFLLRKAHMNAVAIFIEEIGELKLTPPQHNVLSVLLANPGCHQTEVGRLVGYDRATVGAVIVGLEARGLVERSSSGRDRRIKTLTVTRKGRNLINASNLSMDRINQKLLEPLAVHERPLFVALLAKLAFPQGIPVPANQTPSDDEPKEAQPVAARKTKTNAKKTER